MRLWALTDSQIPQDTFVDDSRPAADNAGPHVLVADGFYDDPGSVRALGLSQEYVQFTPPLAAQVGIETASLPEFEPIKGAWRATALLKFRGRPVAKPFLGFRHNPESLRLQMEDITSEHVPSESWVLGGDGWNGVFHLRDSGHTLTSVHHHYKAGDVSPRGWSGLVYLSPNPPKGTGTSFWRDKDTGKCVAGMGVNASKDFDRFERIYTIENVYNRLVLFRENVLHSAECGFGQDREARLTQTFFFLSERRP